MSVAYQDAEFQVDAAARRIKTRFRLVNQSSSIWRREDGFSIGWQIFDPETSTFIEEGEWVPISRDLTPAETEPVELELSLPPEKGRYHVYISPIHPTTGWFYQNGQQFLLVDACVDRGRAELREAESTTLRAMRRKNFRQGFGGIFSAPVRTVWDNLSLIRSMVRRDVMSRYRGSFGDVAWTVLNPLLLMSTYFFVFGIVLQSRFGADNSRTGFVLYFLAGMLPWLPFSEAVGRAPHVIVEHRNFVKKLVFPVETLPANQVISGFVTEAFALLVFLIALVLIRGVIPITILWLPALLVPQLLLTLGTSWFLAALGVFVRDLSQIIGFVLTLVFFLTPICYAETAVPPQAGWLLTKSPIFALVRGYRAILLEGHAPSWSSLWKLWLLSALVCMLGHAWFQKLRKSFADVV
jgi:lipopolysaccharide transport system permease protein